jgi:hypothetical protein
MTPLTAADRAPRAWLEELQADGPDGLDFGECMEDGRRCSGRPAL